MLLHVVAQERPGSIGGVRRAVPGPIMALAYDLLVELGTFRESGIRAIHNRTC
jgi:hypothetical protein